jgi:hypothetical protein
MMGNNPYARHLEEDSKEWWVNQNRGAKKSKIATKIRSRPDIMKRDRVKIVLV